MKDYYAILGVREDAFEDEIRDRWLDLVKDHHPDLVTDGTMDERIKEINEAYQVLKNPAARLEYDFQRAGQQKARKPVWRRWVSVSCSLALLALLGVIFLLEAEDFMGWKPISGVSTSASWSATFQRARRSAEPSTADGVPTAKKITSASSAPSLRLVVNCSRPARTFRRTRSERPGS